MGKGMVGKTDHSQKQEIYIIMYIRNISNVIDVNILRISIVLPTHHKTRHIALDPGNLIKRGSWAYVPLPVMQSI